MATSNNRPTTGRCLGCGVTKTLCPVPPRLVPKTITQEQRRLVCKACAQGLGRFCGCYVNRESRDDKSNKPLASLTPTQRRYQACATAIAEALGLDALRTRYVDPKDEHWAVKKAKAKANKSKASKSKANKSKRSVPHEPQRSPKKQRVVITAIPDAPGAAAFAAQHAAGGGVVAECEQDAVIAIGLAKAPRVSMASSTRDRSDSIDSIDSIGSLFDGCLDDCNCTASDDGFLEDLSGWLTTTSSDKNRSDSFGSSGMDDSNPTTSSSMGDSNCVTSSAKHRSDSFGSLVGLQFDDSNPTTSDDGFLEDLSGWLPTTSSDKNRSDSFGSSGMDDSNPTTSSSMGDSNCVTSSAKHRSDSFGSLVGLQFDDSNPTTSIDSSLFGFLSDDENPTTSSSMGDSNCMTSSAKVRAGVSQWEHRQHNIQVDADLSSSFGAGDIFEAALDMHASQVTRDAAIKQAQLAARQAGSAAERAKLLLWVRRMQSVVDQLFAAHQHNFEVVTVDGRVVDAAALDATTLDTLMALI